MTLRPMLLPALVLLLCLGSVSQAQFIKLSADAKTTAQSNNSFAWDLQAQIGKQDGNLFYSPYSISSALAMTYAGAKGQTAQQMVGTLHFDLPEDRFHSASGELFQYLNLQDKKRPYQLTVANALWGQTGLNFLPAFLNLTETKYGAKLAELDFMTNPEPSRHTINAWVEKQTNDKIKDLIPQGAIKPLTRLVLTNAIYFKSMWDHKFKKANTKEEDFTLANGTKIQAKLMAKTEKMAYAESETYQAVSIPYSGQALSMIVLLPKQANGLAALEKDLHTAQLTQVLKTMKPHEVNLKLPKFKVTTQFMLGETLAKMGMKLAFTNKADFSGMTTQDMLYISEVIHKAYVEVNEEGTEAAAATAVIMFGGGLPQPSPKATFHADRPFLFLIRENQSGAILFMGRVANPNG